MTREEILKLEAGRELDKLVAEKVTGWKNVRIKSYMSAGCYWVGESPRGTDDRLPRYSTDISDAWKVVEKLRDDKKVCHFSVAINGSGYEVAWMVRGNGDWKYARAETAPLAICRAALLAVLDVTP